MEGLPGPAFSRSYSYRMRLSTLHLRCDRAPVVKRERLSQAEIQETLSNTGDLEKLSHRSLLLQALRHTQISLSVLVPGLESLLSNVFQGLPTAPTGSTNRSTAARYPAMMFTTNTTAARPGGHCCQQDRRRSSSSQPETMKSQREPKLCSHWPQ